MPKANEKFPMIVTTVHLLYILKLKLQGSVRLCFHSAQTLKKSLKMTNSYFMISLTFIVIVLTERFNKFGKHCWLFVKATVQMTEAKKLFGQKA